MEIRCANPQCVSRSPFTKQYPYFHLMVVVDQHGWPFPNQAREIDIPNMKCYYCGTMAEKIDH